jgi:protein-S-isoprenylcysteine O-methyltransferase Ste14
LVRNPIYSAMLVFEFGIALLATNLVTIAGLLSVLAALELQVRRVEEPYLLAKQSAHYRDYTDRVGRFVPGVGLIH